MRKIPLAILFVLLFLNANSQNRNRYSFNDGWSFKLDSTWQFNNAAAGDASDWRKLSLPHDWSIEGKFSKDNPATAGGGALPGGVGWYRKKLTVPSGNKNKKYLIEFDGVYRNSEVWINGHSLGIRPNGYISFQYDLTPYLNYDQKENTIIVKVDNLKQPNSRWYSGSGIYRNVWLKVVDKVHVDYNGTFITTPVVNKNTATVNINTDIRNSYAANQRVTVKTIIYDAARKEIGKRSNDIVVPSDGKIINELPATQKQSFEINKPVLWSLEKPTLYRAVTELLVNGKKTDIYETDFGIRSFEFDIDKGFSLNGKTVKILGVCDHHDLGALGAAINTRALQRQLEILKAMGCNGIRTSHNPPAPELLDLCDKMGFVVMDEAFDMWAKQKTKYDYHLDWKDWHKKDLEDQVIRDRNHPSVFIWSVGNEIPEQGGNAEKGDTSGRVIARELTDIVKALDTTRPITTANNNVGTKNNIILSNAFDMVGYNYNHNAWAGFHERWPGKKFIVTESTSALQTRGFYDLVPSDTIRRWPKRWDAEFKNPDGSYNVSSYDHISAPWGSTHEESIHALKKSEHVSGMYIWTGFDYLGEPTPYDWPARSSYFGIIDLAGFPKDVYYLYQSEFTDQPVLHIYPHWNWKDGDTVDVVCYYNNADEVELFLNGNSLGKKKKSNDDLHITWRVPYKAGTVKAISRKNGKTVLTKEIKTAGEPAAIILHADRNRITADGKDLSFITATIVDNNGIKVPDANNLIHFTVSGDGSLVGVDSGDPVSHESFKGDSHTALNGLALAIIQAGKTKGAVTVKATGTGLTGQTITIQIQ
jgi:beta-galactosidase